MLRRQSITRPNAQKYWTQYLADVEPCHFPRFEGEIDGANLPLLINLASSATNELLQVAAKDIDMLSSALRVTWALLLRLYTGMDDVCFGFLENRRQGGGADPTGPLPIMRMRLSGTEPLSKSLESTKKEFSKWSRYQGHGSEEIHAAFESNAQRLYNSEIVIRHYGPAWATRENGKLSATLAGVPENHVRLNVKYLSGGLSIFLEWWSAEMSTKQAKSVAETFQLLLQAVLTQPDALLDDLKCFSDYDMEQFLSWNTASMKKTESCIHELIHLESVKRPNDEAICSWDGSFTYKMLDQLSGRLATYLVSKGVGPESHVPLCFDKSAWNVISMLAVMRAGGAFVPIDPTSPVPRLQKLVRRVEGRILLCSPQHSEKLRDVTPEVIPVGKESMDALQESLSTKSTSSSPSNAAYIIFTSGSTGEPKPTLIEHSAYVSGAEEHGPAMLMKDTSRVLQFAAHTFDASLVEILTTLLMGGCVCIPREDARLNDIAGAIRQMNVNWAVLTPSFISFLNPSDVPGLETLVLAGEAMSATHVENWSKINLVNGYGPSEAAVASVVNSHVRPDTHPTNIGTPVGIHCWVVDPANHDRLLPHGCVGELLLEGPTLARGYFNDSGKTASSFISNPGWADSNDQIRKFYKTGDLVRWNINDGTLFFAGRKDNQVKVHGQRVELGEIEHHICSDLNVEHGVVLFPKSGFCSKRLVAVVTLRMAGTANGSTTPAPMELLQGQQKEAADSAVATVRERLSTTLPAYMIPSLWLVVGSIPMLPSGKLDRRKCVSWVDDMPEAIWNQVTSSEDSDENQSGPLTETARELQSIWSHVLNISPDQIGRQRSFLRLGGDSISAMQVVSQCQKKGLALTVQEVLRAESLSSLAELVKGVEAATDYKEETELDFGLSPIQQMFYALPGQGQGHFNQSFFLRLARPTTTARVNAALQTIIGRHSMLRARFSHNPFGGGWQQRVTDNVQDSYRFRIHRIGKQQDATDHNADAQLCLDPVNGPLFAAEFFDVSQDGQQLLFLVGHHLVIDLVSWRVILEDFEDLLGESTTTTPKPSLPFQTWCQLQAQHCKELLPEQVLPPVQIPSGDLAYWGMADKANTYGQVSCEGFEIDERTSSQLLTSCHQALRTDVMDILASALLHSFRRSFADREVPALYVEGHGREPWDSKIDLSRTVGWFTTMYPIHVDVTERTTDTVRRVKDYRRQVLANGRPYFASRVLSSKGRSAFSRHWPLEVTFNYLGQYQQLEREDSLLKPAAEMSGEARAAGGSADYGINTPRFGLFEISAVIVKGKLRFSFTFNRHMNHQNLIRNWISDCSDFLKESASVLSNLRPEPTLTDFPHLKLTYEQLHAFTTQKLPVIGIKDVNNIEDLYPCSPIQEGLLLSQSRNADFYAVQVVYEVAAKHPVSLDSTTLAKAWKEVVSRHPLLRTVFVDNIGSGTELYDQIVFRQIIPNIVVSQCGDENEALELLNQKLQSPYGEGADPPHRFTICSKSGGKVFFKLEIAHTIMDGASMSVIIKDLERAIQGRLSGALSVYRDYVAHINQQPKDKGTKFWKQYLSGAEPCHFPVLNDGFAKERKLGSLRISFSELSQLQKACEKMGITLSNAIHTAWALTLRSYTGQTDTCFGYLTSGRDAPIDGLEEAVGPFINTLVCRVGMESNVSLKDVLERVQQDYVESLPYRFVSLAEVQHSLQLSGTALFNTALSYRRLPRKDVSTAASVEFVEVAPIYDPTEYNVSLNVEVSDEDVAIDLDYWTDVLSHGQAAHVASLFQSSLANIASHPNRRIADLDNFSELSRKCVLSWNKAIPASLNMCMHEVFEQQVRERPEAQAICGWDAEFTYADLNNLSNRLAHYLVKLGVLPETLVPLCFDKSAWTTVAMLAVLKAGGGFVPLDANHPKNALELRVQDAGSRIVLASPARSEMFEDMVPHVITVGPTLLEKLPHSTGVPCSTVGPDNIAVVIYTSGSTGRPKGVILTHDGLATSSAAHGPAMNIGPSTRALQFAAYTFDNTLEETMTTLMRGGCVCVPTDHDRLNDLAGIINRFNVNWTDLTPTVASFLKPSDVPTLKDLGLGGEAVTKGVLELWRDAPVQIHCVYGPSECSINCSWNGAVAQAGEVTNIGNAIGCLLWIVDPDNHNKLAPVGCSGELVVQGPIVGRGYLNDPEKTAAAFIENPTWANIPSGQKTRLYKTGDLCRYNTDSSITYLGRKDTQVKLHGQRLELAEIEHHIQSNLSDEAQSAVELVVTNGRKQLATFLHIQTDNVVPATSETDFLLPMSVDFNVMAIALQQKLTELIPSYMVPTMFVPVSRMPLTSSGKLDRKRLRLLPGSLSEQQVSTYRLAGKSGRAPSTDMEISLQNMWKDVLNVDANSIGVDDSFFRLGGDSIGAMKLVNAARNAGIVLSIATIFQKPNLAEMAQEARFSNSGDSLSGEDLFVEPFSLLGTEIDVDQLLAEVSGECGISTDAIEDIYPCTQLQEGLIALSMKQPGAYVAQNTYRLPQNVDIARFKAAWDAIINAEVVLRTRIYYSKEFGFFQVVVQESTAWFAGVDLHEIMEEDRILPTHNGGGLTRYAIIGEGTEHCYFVWTLHHALYDGWCIPTILERVEAYYRNSTFPSQMVMSSYPRFIKHLASISQDDANIFWQGRLAEPNAVPFPALPQPNYQVQAKSHIKHVAATHRAPGSEFTMASIARAAWALTVSIYSGSDDVIFGETLTGRDSHVAGIEDMIGPTLATVPTRVIVNRENTILEFLQDVQSQSVEAIAFQHAGLQNIKRLNRDTAAACQFQNLIAINQGFDDPVNELWDMQSSGTVGTNFFTYPLMLQCTVGDSSVEFEANYDQEILAPWQAERLLHQFALMVESLNTDNETVRSTKLGQITIASPFDERTICDWNRPLFPKIKKCIHDMIYEKNLSQSESKLAVIAWDGELTYPGLDSAASRLAHHLCDQGIQPGSLVPILFEKSVWAVVAMLGILKAGAAFVPLDPAHPVARLKELVTDTGALFVVCSTNQKDVANSICSRTVVLDRFGLARISTNLSRLQPSSHERPAYVIFTSGTTGRPKGTIIQHAALATSVVAQARSLRINEDTRALQFASFTFDASIIEIITTLYAGGCVCIPSEHDRLNDLAGFINKTEANWTLLTPTFIQLMQPSQIPTMSTIVLGGEAASQHNISVWSDKVQLLNAYGPTEYTVVATVNHYGESNSQASNIGKGIAGRIWVVDSHNINRLAPIGSIGELLLEGPTLAQGYLNNPTKTAEAFIGEPTWAKSQTLAKENGLERRFYRTGDLVKYEANGSILYLGRKDEQVKLHGQRMELGEVEHHLKTDAMVQHALVTIPTSGPCKKRLVAVLSLQELTAHTSNPHPFDLVSSELSGYNLSAIRDRLTERLPSYMIPSKWIVLRELPVLASSKLDRKRTVQWLEAMDEDTFKKINTVESTTSIARQPVNDIERKLQAILGQILNLPAEEIGLNQSFVHLGGDSISAMQVMSRCRAEGLGTNVQDIIRSKSIAQLASRVHLPKAVSYTEEPINQLFGLSPIQRIYFDCVGDKVGHFNQSVLLRLTKRFDTKTLHAAVETIVKSHRMLRARFLKDDNGNWRQKITDDAVSSYSFNNHDVQSLDDGEVVRLVEESQKSLDISNGPLFAADLFSIDNGSSVISLVAHHLVTDVVSWRIIMQDLEDILGAGSTTSHTSMHFQTWSRLQQEQAQKDHPSSVLPFTDVPIADFAYWGMDSNTNIHSDTVTEGFILDTETTLVLLGKGNEAMQTEPVDIFLAAVAQSFGKTFIDRERVPAIFNEGHGREPWDTSLDLSHTVGWFTTMTPIVVPSERDNDIVNSVRWIKELRARIPGKGRPYFANRMLTDEGRQSCVGHWPMEITFNYLGQAQQLERKDTILQPVMGLAGMPETSVTDVSSSVPRFSLFEISVGVSQGGLSFSFTFNKQMQRQNSIRSWVSECQKSLQEAAIRLVQLKTQLTLADFPLLPLAYNGVEEMEQYLPRIGTDSFDDVEDIYPCSPMQQGLLLSQLKNPQYYAFSCIFEAKSNSPGSPVDARRLAESWQAVVDRHTVLRTSFVESACKKGAMDQVVLKNVTARTAWLQSEASTVLEILTEQKSINCREVQPPHRLTLCIAPDGKLFCKIEMSHTICDGTSIPMILRDLALAYQDHTWMVPAMPFSDFIAHLQSSTREADINYWKTYLANIEPCYFPSLNESSNQPNAVCSLDRTITSVPALQSFCTKHGLTLSNALQLVWALVIRCYTGSQEVCFGYVASGRDAPVEGIHDAIGAFINMLICKMDLPEDLRLDAALQKIQSDFVAGMAHQQCSLAEVQHELKLSGVALFNTAFTFQKRSNSRSLDDAPINFEVLSAEDPSEYTITINAEATDEAINLSFTYWLHTLSDAQAESIANTFESLLVQITCPENLEKTVGDLDFFNRNDREQVMQWNGTTPPRVDKCIHDIVSQQAILRPKSTPAVCAWNAEYTYTELDRVTSKLAAHLVKLGLGPEVFVPLCFEKSGYYIVSMLAVMKAGGAFVPLDPAHPASRIKNLVDNVKGNLILCSSQHKEKASEAAKMALVVDEAFLDTIADETPPTMNLASPENAAYIIFTSGTTGMPKGTVIEHGAFCTGALAHSKAMNMTCVSRVLQFASHTFDASIMEILSTLLVGGCVCIPSDQDRMNDLPAAMENLEVNWTLLTPSVANTIKPDSVPSLRVLVTGGEAMSAGHIDRWGDSKCLVNAYGPSETSVIATISMKVDLEGNKLDGEPSNIGHAVGGRCWIVDPKDYNKLMPIGCVGELVVEGRIVAREYLNNAAKTAFAFVSRPAWMKKYAFGGPNGDGDRMYRTGDLVRYNADGSFNFVARKDTQIKLNGQRIELGEIEYHVRNNLPEHSQAAVELVTPAGKTAAKALAAFYCYESNQTGSASRSDNAALSAAEPSTVDDILLPMSGQAQEIAKALENALGSALPSYMIPALYVPVKKLPWTTAGKLDRQRLRNVVQALPKEMVAPYRLAAASNKRAPTSEMEKKLIELWESVLGLAKGSVGVDDNFFRVGGDSLAAMRLVSAATAASIAVTVINIFRKPKLSDMAKICTVVETEVHGELKPFSLLKGDDTAEEAIDELATQCRVTKETITDAYPCSSLQEGLFTLSIKQPGAYVANNVFKLPKTLDIDRFRAAWQKTADEVDILRTRLVHMRSSAFIQTVLKSDTILWNHASDLESVTTEAPRLPAHNGGVLTKYSIVDLEETGERFLVWAIHHALYDGWSMPLVLKRVEQVYFEGETTLARTPYAKFVKYLSDNDLQASEDFWKSRLSGATPLSFPQPLPSATKLENSTQTLVHVAQLGEAFAGMGITMPTLIRAAWAIIVAAYSGSDDVVYGETMTGRDVPMQGITDVFGPTLTTVPTRIQINRTKPVMNFLEEIGRMNTDTIPHQHLGLQHIRRLDSDTSQACDFQNLLVIQMAQEQGEKSFWEVYNSGVGANFFTYPLVIEARADEKHVEIEAHHDIQVVSQWQAQRLLYQFESVLQQLNTAMRKKTGKVDDIRTYSPQDVSLLKEWNSNIPKVANDCIHDLILKTSTRQPNAQAVSAWDGNLTYGQLTDYAGRLANRLSKMGVNKEVKIPICINKSKWAIVAIMGILMAGGAYVPLDPNHPASRHTEILADVQARILLCSPQHQGNCSKLVEMVIPIDEETIDSLPQLTSPSALSGRASPSNAAYVIYTSGSTGKPKGTVVEHRAFCSSSDGYTKAQLMKPESRVFQFASFTFDVSCMEILSTMILGGCVCVPSEKQRLKDPGAAIHEMNATWAFLTPSVANVIEPTAVPSLEVLVCGGEAMAIENVLKWDGHVTLVNGYGPTEASVISVVNNKISETKDPGTIGKPTGGVSWVTDPNNHERLAPVGSIGEMLLEGPFLAREYLNNKEKTKEAFIENPQWMSSFLVEPQMRRRLYKTGDLVKFNHDGSLAYIGRKDNQVKLNGQRLELGEIEHRMDTNPKIRHSLVVLPKKGPCKKRLVAVLSLASLVPESLAGNTCRLVEAEDKVNAAKPQLSQIQETLSGQLPPYMVPTVWVVVESVPLLPSGKLDRRVVTTWLESMEDSTYDKINGVDSTAGSGSPATVMGKLLQDIIAKVLNVAPERVTPNQSFLGLGGDSISAMQVLARCRKEKVTISLNDILRSKSVAQMALCASTGDQILGQEEKVDQLFDLSPIQKLYMESATGTAGDSRFNQSFTLRVTKAAEPQTIKKAIEAIVAQHSMLRARFCKNKDGWQQKITADIQTSYRFNDHGNSAVGEMVQAVGRSQSGLNIEKGPLFTVDLFNHAGKDQVIVLVGHHLVVDMVSWRVILQDLEELLDSGSLSMAKPMSFQAWNLMQAEHAQKNSAKSSKKILPFKVVPADMQYWNMVDRPNLYGETESDAFTIGEALTELALGKSNKALGTEPIDLLLSVVAHSFSRIFTDRPTPTLWNEGHGREPWDTAIDLSRTIGWFTTITPAQVQVEKSSDNVINTIKRMKDARRQVPANGRPYFAHRYLTPEGRWQFGDHMPMEIIFNYLGKMQQLEADDSLLQQFEYADNSKDSMVIADVGSKASRFALFEVSAVVVRDKLQFSFIYNRNMGRQDSIKAWMRECKKTLEEAVQRLASSRAEPTLSDYPVLPITYDEMQQMVDETFPEAGIKSPEEVEDVYPCAPMQEGLFLSQLRDSSSYLFSCVYEVDPVDPKGKIDGRKLFNSWQRVVDRHPALRSLFVDSVCRGGVFDQIVLKKADSGILYMECDDEEALDKLATIKLTETNYAKRPRLPHQGTVCVLKSGKVLFKLEVNHAVIDGGSAAIIIEDFIASYEDRLPEGEGPLYSDYIKYIRGQPPSSDVSFWKNYLEDLRPCYFPSINKEFTGEKKLGSFEIDFKRYGELQELCSRTKVTFSNILQVAWAIVLRKYTGSDDVCFGYLTAGRDAPVHNIETSVGAFINMLVCRIRFAKTQTLHQVFEKVQNDYLDSIPYQHCSLAQMQHELGLEGKALFNTAMSIQNHSKSSDFTTGSITMEPCAAHDPSEYSVTVNVETMRDDEGVVFRYWTNTISHEQAKTLGGDMASVLGDIIDNSQQTLAELDGIKETPQIQVTPAVPQFPANFDLESSLRRIVSECVREVVGQLVQSGELMRRNANEVQTVVQNQTNKILHNVHEDVAVEEAEDDFEDRKLPVRLERRGSKLGSIKEDVKIGAPETPANRRATRNAVRQKLLVLWGTLLDMSETEIGNDDSFFGLGGDSIIAMKMVGLARESGLTMTVADVFRHPTFGEMAQVVKIAQHGKARRGSIAIDPEQAKREAAIQIPYSAFGLLKADDVDAFLQAVVVPMVHVFRGGIADVFPVTDFQALAITGASFASKWMLNYFYLDGNGPLDVARLKQSAFKLVQNFDILRTVFIPHLGQFLQVVLRNLQPEFVVEDTDKDLDDYATDLHRTDLETKSRSGESYVKFVVAKKIGTDQHRIFLRMSHAQYDGVCFSTILQALKAGYEGGPVPYTQPFANYVWMSAGGVTKGHYEYWTNLLAGSSMTHIVRRDGPNYSPSATGSTVLKRTVRVPSLSSQNITTATVVKSAWALALGTFAAKSDVVFGHVISGRNSSISGIENIMGPCLNMVPVRVNFMPGWTAIDLLRTIQEQQISNIEYESLGFREITKHCTEWPDWTYFSTIVQHQNIDRNQKLTIGGNNYDLGAVSTHEDFADLSLLSTPLDGDDLELSLSISSAVVENSPSFADDIMQLLCDTVKSLPRNPHKPLPSPEKLLSLLPKTLDDTDSVRKQSRTSPSESAEFKTMSKDELSVLHDVLSRAWREILRDRSGQPLHFRLDSSFYNLGGDIQGVTQVASLLEQDGYKVKVDDLAQEPVMLEQLALLASCNSRKKRAEDARRSKIGVLDEKTSDGKGGRPRAMSKSKRKTIWQRIMKK